MIDKLKAISEQCKTDAEFLAHPEVRRVYWLALGKATGHKWILWSPGTVCAACGVSKLPDVAPCPIPGSLADAAERLREKVAEKWPQYQKHLRVAMYPFNRLDDEDHYVLDTSRDRFIIFAAALVGNEIQKEQ